MLADPDPVASSSSPKPRSGGRGAYTGDRSCSSSSGLSPPWGRASREESTPVLGCVSVGVGRTPPRPGGVRGVVGAGEVAAHQSFRNEGIVSCIAVISGVGRQPPGDHDV